LWSRQVDANGGVTGLAVDPNGAVYLVGARSGYGTAPGATESFIWKYSADGEPLSAPLNQFVESSQPWSIASGGGVIAVAGEVAQGGSASGPAFVLRLGP
jgi:hypothetical protein